MVRTVLDDHKHGSPEALRLIGLLSRDYTSLPQLVTCGDAARPFGPVSVNAVEERLPSRTLHMTTRAVIALTAEEHELLIRDGAITREGSELTLQLLMEGGDARDSRKHGFIFRVGGGGSCTCGEVFRGQNPDEEFVVHAADAHDRAGR